MTASKNRTLVASETASNTKVRKALYERAGTDDTKESPLRVFDAAGVLTTAWDALNYYVDTWQRSVLYLDALRQRADNLIDHEKNGMPPLLDFAYETVLDGRTLNPPANYALLEITEIENVCAMDCVDPQKPPIIIVDPRAGHGPGIGGFRRESEVGMAIHEGHTVYFVVFFPQPEPHQKITDVLNVLRVFVEEVKKRHGDKDPILYGNCQAGWMLTLLAADCRGVDGPIIINASPLSYWASGEELSPMQVNGSLAGGVWSARLLADLGNGILDGAWLVQNFEMLNPANAWWEKYYNLFAHVDTECDSFLAFERWWSGFYSFSEEEITATAGDLFIGNKLERGELQLGNCCKIDLKRMRNPLLIFASNGDNITPPRQALHWIRRIYPTTEALKAAGQRIIFLINPEVGHLGIFVSAKVANLEHRAIIEQAQELEQLEPGLYEMKIINSTGELDCRLDQYVVHFEPRQVEDLGESISTHSFENVRRLSEWGDAMYCGTLHPWLKLIGNPYSAALLRALHPMRVGRVAFSARINPWMWPTMMLAAAVSVTRTEAPPRTPFHDIEKELADWTSLWIHQWSGGRDWLAGKLFKKLFG